MGRVNHVGLTVTDLRRSVAFYRDVVGLDVLLESFPVSGEWFDTLTGNQGAEVDTALLGDGDLRLQLVQYRAGGTGPAVTGHNRIGNLHLCVEVPDVDAAHQAVLASGRHVPTPLVDLPVGGARSFYLSDPDGVPVELIQLHATAR
jgi:catechol 2,3-dioxygenase-like lactoylglutathione lyase family enzyme